MHYLVYLFPILLNMMDGGMFFITAYRFSEAGASKMLITGTMVSWALAYCITVMLSGRLVNSRRAPYLIILGCLGMLGASLGGVLLPALMLQFVWIGLLGIGSGLFAPGFQVFMKSLECGSNGGTVRSVALYTFAWSLGIAIGPFIFSVLDWHIAYYINSVCSLLIALGIWLIGKYCPRKEDNSNEPPVQEPMFAGFPNLVLVGWLGGFCVSMCVSIVRSLEPDLAVQFNVGQLHGGLVQALVSFAQALTGLAFCRSQTWMYEKKSLLIAALLGIAGLLLMTLGKCNVAYMYLAAILCGIYTGIAYYMFTFHSLVHPTKNGFYVSMNELLVGIASVVCPFFSGILASGHGTVAVFYTMSGVVLLFYLLQLKYHCNKTDK